MVDPDGSLWWPRAALANAPPCKTRASLPRTDIRRPRDTPIWKLEAALKCRSCKRGRYSPPVHMIKLTMEREIAPYIWVHPDEDDRRYCRWTPQQTTFARIESFRLTAHSVTSRVQIRWPIAGTQRHQFWLVIAIRPDARCSGSIGSSNPADVYPKGLQWGMGDSFRKLPPPTLLDRRQLPREVGCFLAGCCSFIAGFD